MKLRNYFLSLLVIASITSLQSCKDDTDDGGSKPTQSISEYLISDGGYVEFMAALDAAGITSKITGSGSFTLLAVSDAQLIDDGVDLSSMTNDEKAAFANYHFIGSKKSPGDFVNTGYTSSEATSATGGKLSIYTEVTGASVRFNGKQANTNYEATNGMVYVLNGSLKQPTLIDHLANNPNLANYKIGVNTQSAIKTELEKSPNTVFAINDDDLVAYLETQEVIRIGDLAPSAVRALLYNTLIYGKAYTSSQLQGTISTEGDDISATSGADVMLNGDVKVIRKDIIGTNGVMHIIDDIL